MQDIYGPQRILKDGGVPRSLVYSCQHFRREMIGLEVPRSIHTHISGIDLVRDSKTGEYFVLEDNVRTPSGISYVIENRLAMTRTFPELFESCQVLPVNQLLGNGGGQVHERTEIVPITGYQSALS